MLGKKPIISLIFVNYNSAQFLKKALESLFLQEQEDMSEVEVVIVNNDSNESEIIQQIGSLYQARVIETGQNIGFGRAVNRGVEESQGIFLGMLNPDTLWPKKQLLRVVKALQDEEAFVGLSLLDEYGVRERYGFGKRIHFWRLLLNHLSASPKSIQGRLKVDWISGGALFCSRNIFEKLGGFDEYYFLYYEDVDLCERARKMGIPLYVYDDMRVIHFRGKSQKSPRAQKREYYRSQKYFFKKTRPVYEQWLLAMVHFLIA